MTPDQAWLKYVGEDETGAPYPVERFLANVALFAPPEGVTPEWAVDYHLSSLDAAPEGDEREQIAHLLTLYIGQHSA